MRRALAERLEVHPERTAANLGLTHGRLFADAAAARLGAKFGRETAHALVERAAGEVRRSGEGLQEVLERMPEVLGIGIDLAGAFDLGPAVAAASPWIDRALADAERVRVRLFEEP